MNLLHLRDDFLLKRYRSKDKKVLIELKLESPSHLFDQRDPSPLRERDLHESVVRHIVESLNDFPSNYPVTVALYFTQGLQADEKEKCEKAFRNFFAFESRSTNFEMKKKMMLGLKAVFMGLNFLLLYIFAADYLKDSEVLYLKYAVEVLHVIGWVSLWPAVYIFLYELSPLRDKRDLLQSIAEAELTLSNTPYQGPYELDSAI